MSYKLSPSDFAYLYEECKHCYYQKVRLGIGRPFAPFPSVFSALNTRLQGALVGHDLRTMSETLPEGIVESQEGFVESVPYTGTQIYIKGKYDLLVKQPDGRYLVIDFKISLPHEDKIEKYRMQLQSYKFAFESPARGAPVDIAKMGLIVMYPDKVKFEDGRAFIDFPPMWLEIVPDDRKFASFMNEVNTLVTGPEPMPGPECEWCKYGRIMAARNTATASDLPF